MAHFNPEQPITVSADASKGGLGGILLQQGKPVEYTSSAMTQSQRNYSQSEKELLAIVSGCKKFHKYIWGHKATIFTAHKPLEVFKNPLCETTPRLQRLLLQLQQYELDVKYLPGEDMVLADMLSRSGTVNTDWTSELDEILDKQVLNLQLGFTGDRKILDAIRSASNEDKETQALVYKILHGWPEDSKQIESKLSKYWSVRNDLAYIDGLVCLKDRILVPEKVRDTVLKVFTLDIQE